MTLAKNSRLIVLGVSAMVCSRAMFWFLADPEGPNLLIVTVMAMVIYTLAFWAYLLLTKVTIWSVTSTKRWWLIGGIQLIIALAIYFGLS